MSHPHPSPLPTSSPRTVITVVEASRSGSSQLEQQRNYALPPSSAFIFQQRRPQPQPSIPLGLAATTIASALMLPSASSSPPCMSGFVPVMSSSSVMMSPPSPPLPALPATTPLFQRQYSSSIIPVVASTALPSTPMSKTLQQPSSAGKMNLPKSSSTSNQAKSKRPSLTKTKPSPPQPDLATLVRLDHNYCIPFESTTPAPVELPPPHAPPRKYVKVIREEPTSRFKPIKYLLNRDENDESVFQPYPKTSPSKLEHLLKRTSMYDGPGGYLTSPRNKLYNYYRDEESVEVDVVSLSPEPDLHCDLEKARAAMNECETHVNFARPTEVDDNWEEQIVKTGWTKVQRQLFSNVMKVLHSEHFARLAYEGNSAEVVLRRNSLDLTSHRVRKALVNVCWDGKLTQWLHGVLIDNLSHHYLAIYLDILQTLRTHAPALVDRMIVLSTVTPKSHPEPTAPAAPSDRGSSDSNASKPQEGKELAQIINAEAIHLLIKRQWDPFSSVIHHNKGIKLKCNPVFLLVPAGPSWGQTVNIRRHKNFVNMLSNLGKVITVTMAPEISTCSYLSVDELAEKMILSSKMRLTETKSQLPDRPIYLVGWGTGSIIATTVSLTEQAAGVICLGFPIFGIAGRHGEGSDPLLQMKHPVLFVIGDRATNCTISLLEEFREDLSNLQDSAYIVAIKSADEYLRVSRHHRKRLLVTQSYVDKCIVDEISLFVNDSFDAKSSVPILPPLNVTNPADYGSNEVSSKKRLSVNGEPIEGLGLSLALSNGHDPDEEDAPKKNRRKSYHRKSASMDDDLSISELSGSQSLSPRLTPPRKYRTKTMRLEQEISGENNDGTRGNSYEGSNGGLPQPPTSSQSFVHPSYPGITAGYMTGASGLLGTYPYFAASEGSHAYSVAYQHVANQAAAIQHAIAMETVEGYNQYYSQLEKYNASSQYQENDPTQKGKKPRKPREFKQKGDKPPRRPYSRRTKAEKAAETLTSIGTSASNETGHSNPTETNVPLMLPSSRDHTETGHNVPKPSTLIQLLGQPREDTPAGNPSTMPISPPYTALPLSSITMASAFSSSSSVISYNQATSSFVASSSSTQVFAVKSLPPNLTGSLTSKISEPSPMKTDSAPRSPPLLIPTLKSPNRIPIRLCLQTDPHGNGSNSTRESIEASLVPVPVDEPRDETSNLPPLVPVRVQPKVVPSEPKSGPLAAGVEKTEEPKTRQRFRSGDLSANQIAVENAKNLQVKLPRLSLPSKSGISSEPRRLSASAAPTAAVAAPDIPSKPIPSSSSSSTTISSSSSAPKLSHDSKIKTITAKGASSSGKKPSMRTNIPTGHSGDKVEANRKFPPQIESDTPSTEDEDIAISQLRTRNIESKKSLKVIDSSDESSVSKKPNRLVENASVGKKSKAKDTFKTVDSDEGGGLQTSAKKTKRTLRAGKIVEIRIDSSEDDEISATAKKNVSKRNRRIESSEDEEEDDGPSTNVRKGRANRRTSKVESSSSSSEDEIIPMKKSKRISKIVSSDEEIEPKLLRSRTQVDVKAHSGDDTGRRTRRSSKRQSYAEEVDETSSSGSDEAEEKMTPLKRFRKKSAENPKPVVEKRKTRQSSGGDGNRRTEPNTPSSSKSIMERRMTRGSDEKRRPDPEIEPFDVDTEATTEEDEGDRRVTRFGSHSFPRRPSSTARGESETRKSREQDEEDEEEDGSGGSRRLKSIFPVTPASLAATRTRKVNIPKFYAYGM